MPADAGRFGETSCWKLPAGPLSPPGSYPACCAAALTGRYSWPIAAPARGRSSARVMCARTPASPLLRPSPRPARRAHRCMGAGDRLEPRRVPLLRPDPPRGTSRFPPDADGEVPGTRSRKRPPLLQAALETISKLTSLLAPADAAADIRPSQRCCGTTSPAPPRRASTPSRRHSRSAMIKACAAVLP